MATGTDVDPIKSLAQHWLAKNTSPILLELIVGCDLVGDCVRSEPLSNIFAALLWAWVDDTKIFIILVIFAILQKLWYKINIALQRIVQECPFQERTLDKEDRVYQRSKKRKKKNQEKSFRKHKSSANKDMRLGVQTWKRVKGSLLRAVCLFSRSSSSRPSSFTLQQPNTQNWLDRAPIYKWVGEPDPKLRGSKSGTGKTTLLICFSSFNVVYRVISNPL